VSEAELEQAAFETFAWLYPHEAAELDWQRFFAFTQRQNPGITEEQVREALQETKEA